MVFPFFLPHGLPPCGSIALQIELCKFHDQMSPNLGGMKVVLHFASQASTTFRSQILSKFPGLTSLKPTLFDYPPLKAITNSMKSGLFILSKTSNCFKVKRTIVGCSFSFSWSSWMSQPHFGAKCENATHTPKDEKMESSRTPENSEDDLKGQISSSWCIFYINGKLLKRRCPKWPRIAHLDICSPSYGQKKGRESNCQFDSRPLKVGNRPLPDIASRSATWIGKLSTRSTTLVQSSSQSEVGARRYGRPKSRDSNPG